MSYDDPFRVSTPRPVTSTSRRSQCVSEPMSTHYTYDDTEAPDDDDDDDDDEFECDYNGTCVGAPD